jgi:hypothetical protein
MLGPSFIQFQFGIRAERHLALSAMEAVAVDPIGFAVAHGAKIEALRVGVRVASRLLEQAFENKIAASFLVSDIGPSGQWQSNTITCPKPPTGAQGGPHS